MYVLQILVNGILQGGIYAIMAMGFSLVWGVMLVLNISHGALIMLGAYITFWLFSLFGIDPFFGIPIVMAIMFGVGAVLQKYVINYVARAPVFTTAILTWGLDLLFINLALVLWSPNYRSIEVGYGGKALVLGELVVPHVRVLILGISLLLTLALHLFISRTKTGRAIRACRMSVYGSRIVGVNIGKTYIICFAIAAALAGAAGSMLSVVQTISPFMGVQYLFLCFVICTLGGLGSIAGTLVGGITLGIIQSAATAILGPGYTLAISFGALLLILMVRPYGILGREQYETGI